MKTKSKTAFFVGRFQPLHKGHIHALGKLFREYPRIIIAVGSINKLDKDNPFTFEERKRMLARCLGEYKGKYKIIGLRDMGSNEKWARDAIKKAKFDIVITGNNVVKACFIPLGFEVRGPDFYHPERYNGTAIRDLIFKGKKWRHLVPEEVAGIVGRIGNLHIGRKSPEGGHED